ncbi:MAG: hypothetical protein KKH12_03295 [Gammaproteobacteria bacterium]|nr:hypothetical protein [Gammaproteobacteria bacterium]MBU1480680.1 hypothetical protein [Gammaproteobacteria bacterium]
MIRNSWQIAAVALLLNIVVACGGGGSGGGGGQSDTAGGSQVLLNGPLATAEIDAYRLTDLVTPVESGSTSGGNDIQSAGKFDLVLAGIADDEWILVAAKGGTDLATNGTQTPNTGTLYGVARASAWRKGAKLNALTDILWRYSEDWFDEVSPTEFAARLDQIAQMLLQRDLDGGGVGASDLLLFDAHKTPSDNLAFDYSKLFDADGFAANIYANASDASVRLPLGDLFGPRIAFSPPMQMEEETRVSLTVFGNGSLALQSHDAGIALLSGTENNQLVDGQTLIDATQEDSDDNRNLYFIRSSQTLTFKAVPLGASYPAMDQTQILSWDGCDIVSADQSQCTVDLQTNHTVTVNFGYKETTLIANHEFIDLTDRADTVLSNWNTGVDPAQMQLEVSINVLDTELLAQMDAVASGSGTAYYMAGIDSTAGGAPFLLKVLGVASHNTNHWVLNMEEAALEDVIQQGSGMVERTMYPEDLAPDQPLSVRTLSKETTQLATGNPQPVAYLVPSVDPTDPTFHINIGQLPASYSGAMDVAAKGTTGGYTITASDGTSLTLSGSLDVTVAIQTGIQFRAYGLGGVKSFKFVPKLGVKPQINISGNISRVFQKEVTLLTLEFTRIKFMVGPVPVWITPTVGIVLGSDGRLSATVQTAVAYDMSVTGGVQYRRGHGWSKIKSASVGRDFDGPTVTGNANLRAYLSVEPTLFIYDLMGPGLKMQPGLGLNATMTANIASPQCYDMSYALIGSVNGDFSWSLKGRLAKLIGLNKSFDFPIFRWDTALSRRSYNPCNNSPSALKVIGEVGEIAMVQYGSQDRAIHFTLQNNNASPGYALPWSVQIIPSNGHVTVTQSTGQLAATAQTDMSVQLVNTASLSPGTHTTRVVFTNTATQNTDSPRTIEKFITVKVQEQLTPPSITAGSFTVAGPPGKARISWSYSGNIDYVEAFKLWYAPGAPGNCPAVDAADWILAGSVGRMTRTIDADVSYEDYCYLIEAVGKAGSGLESKSAPYFVASPFVVTEFSAATDFWTAFPDSAWVDFDDAESGDVADTRYAARGIFFSRDDSQPVGIWTEDLIYPTYPNLASSGGGVLVVGTVITGTNNINLNFTEPMYAIGAYAASTTHYGNVKLSVFDDQDRLVGYAILAGSDNGNLDQFIGLGSPIPFVKARFEALDSNAAVRLDDVSWSLVPDN